MGNQTELIFTFVNRNVILSPITTLLLSFLVVISLLAARLSIVPSGGQLVEPYQRVHCLGEMMSHRHVQQQWEEPPSSYQIRASTDYDLQSIALPENCCCCCIHGDRDDDDDQSSVSSSNKEKRMKIKIMNSRRVKRLKRKCIAARAYCAH